MKINDQHVEAALDLFIKRMEIESGGGGDIALDEAKAELGENIVSAMRKSIRAVLESALEILPAVQA